MTIIIIRILFLLYFLPLFSQSISKDTVASNQLLKLISESSQYLDTYENDKSLAKARTALKLAFDQREYVLVAKCYYIIAVNYDDLYQLDKAIYYYKKGIFYLDKTADTELKNLFYNNLGNIYCFDLKQYSKGLFYYQKTLVHAEKISNFNQIYTTKLNLAMLYFSQKDFDKGKPYLDYVNDYEKQYGHESFSAFLHIINGMYYGSIKNEKKAEYYFSKAIKLAQRDPNKTDYSVGLEQYAEHLFQNKHYKKAYEIKKLSYEVNDVIKDSMLTSNATNVGKSIEIDEYKRKIDEIETQNNLQLQVIQKSKIISILLVISLIIVLLYIYSLYKNNNFKKVKNLELENKNQELILAKEKAEESSKLKSQFVSTITHELRTPLYGVIGITDMLLDEHQELIDSPHLNSLKFSAKYLLSLINDVLQINKIEDNRIILEQKAFSISEEIEFVKNSLTFLGKKHNNQIAIFVDPNIPEYLIGDKLRLSQILINLMSNALKFTQDGKVVLSAHLVEVHNKLNYVQFTIEDNGVGIAEDDQIKIFEKFVQVNRKEIDYQGTGLGLSIVKQLVELFGSSIILKSQLNIGTSFSFKIGFEYDMFKINAVRNDININYTSGKVLKILIIDDNNINLLVTKKTIEKFKYNCITADSGIQALEILEKESFDVILIDINMPVLNGFETTKIIRKRGINTGVIALTAFDKEEVMEQALSSGFDDVISKPFEVKDLYITINEVFSKKVPQNNFT